MIWGSLSDCWVTKCGRAKIVKGNGSYLLIVKDRPPSDEYPLLGYFMKSFSTLDAAKKHLA